MGRKLLLAIVLAMVPTVSHGIQIRWSSGNSNLQFASTKRCTLEVASEASEHGVPPEWRLRWAARGCDVRPLPLALLTPCPQDVAEVSSIGGPATRADSSARLLTAHFCSPGPNPPLLARYVLDLPTGSAGKLE